MLVGHSYGIPAGGNCLGKQSLSWPVVRFVSLYKVGRLRSAKLSALVGGEQTKASFYLTRTFSSIVAVKQDNLTRCEEPKLGMDFGIAMDLSFT